jgi:hypothetical protein
MSADTKTGSSGGILRSAILSYEATMSEALFVLALVFVAGFGIGYGVRSQIAIMRRAKARRGLTRAGP